MTDTTQAPRMRLSELAPEPYAAMLRLESAVEDARGLTIHVAGRGLFVVMYGKREMFRGTFAKCYDYVNALHLGPRC
jgi:hypothetical protein